MPAFLRPKRVREVDAPDARGSHGHGAEEADAHRRVQRCRHAVRDVALPESPRIRERSDSDVRDIPRPSDEHTIVETHHDALSARRVRSVKPPQSAIRIAQRQTERHTLLPSATELDRQRRRVLWAQLEIFDRATTGEQTVPLTRFALLT